jgi:hypothetical protein
VLATATDARAQEEWLHLDPLRGEVFFEFDGYWRDGTTSDSGRQDLEFTQGFTLQQTGYVIHPRIANLSLDVTPQFSQEDVQLEGQEDDFVTANALSYNGRLSLLQGPEWPVGLVAAGGQSSSDSDGDLGSRNELDVDYLDVALNWQQRIFPTSLNYRQRRVDRTFRALGQSGTRRTQDDFLQTLQLTGNSRKMNVLLQRDWYDDKTPADNDYTYDLARLSHEFNWGKGSELSSRFEYVDRDNFNDTTSLTVDESLRLKHRPNLSSTTSYRYRLTQQETTDIEQHIGTFGLSHLLYRNLNSSLNLRGSTTETDFSTLDQYGGNLQSGYSKKIPWEGTLRLTGGGGYGIDDIDSQDGLLQVFDEPHFVEAITLSFLLDERFVDTSTIIVKDSAAPGAIQFVEGTDYTVSSASNDLTEIFVLSTGAIPVGSTVFVDYQFQSLPTIKYSTTSYNYGVELDFGWIALFRRFFRSDQDRISGANQEFLLDRKDSLTGTELRWIRPRTRATLRAEYRTNDSGDFNSESLIFNQSVFHSLSPQTDLNFNSSQGYTDGDGTDSAIYAANLSLGWRPLSGLYVSPRLGAWWRQDDTATTDGTRDERFYTAGLDLRWNFRRIAVDLRYEHNRREGDEVVTTDEDRVFLRLRRSF